MNQKFLKGGDVAAILNISRTKAFSLMQQGEIRTLRIGKSVRVREEDLELFISRNLSEKKND